MLQRARQVTDQIFQDILPEAWFDRPLPQRHRLIFYLGHLEAFDWNQIAVAGLGESTLDAELDRLFAFGIDPAPGQLPTDQPADWPSLDVTRKYVAKVRLHLDRIIEVAPRRCLDMAFEHRLMHAETLRYLLHQLPYDRRRTCPDYRAVGGDAPPNKWVDIPAGRATPGRERHEGFGWDNEFLSHTVDVPEFAASKYKVTNAQYLKFVNDGGPVPAFWREDTSGFVYHGYYGEIPLPLDWPVYVSHQQATAYCTWSGTRLPSEAEWHRLAEPFPDTAQANLGFANPDAVAVTADAAGAGSPGIEQAVGNGWEWTSTPFAPFEGFVADPSYPGYSADFFDGDHYVLKGASCATDVRLVRPSFRNWFRKEYPYAYTTFRVVE